MGKRGRPPKLTEKDYPMLREVVAARPTATLDEVTAAVEKQTGKLLNKTTVRQALRAAGVVRQKPMIERDTESADRRYGYTDAHRRHEPEQRYPSCLTDAEWAMVSNLFDRPNAQGVPPTHSRRLMVDACCYVVRTGCSWRLLPSDFPHWDNVYKTFRRWSKQGKFEQMHDRLRDLWRERENRAAAPTAAVLDAQSRSSPQGGEHGFDAGKKVKGRKRNLVVDTLGLLLAVTVTAASVQDRDAAHAVVAAAKEKYPSVQTCFVDGGYAGQCAQTLRDTSQLKSSATPPMETVALGITRVRASYSLSRPMPMASSFSPNAGWWSEPMAGTSGRVDSSCITTVSRTSRKPGSGLQKLGFSCAA
jgi:transposase